MIADDGSPLQHPSTSIVVVSYNTAAHIEACLLSILELDYPPGEIIVVDNASTDDSVERVRSHFPDVELVDLPENKGFAGGASVGLYMASGEVVATVNPDVQLDARWMSAVVETLRSEDEVGVVGSKILYPDRKTIQHAGGIVHYPLATTEHIGRGETDGGQFDHSREVQFVTGAALAMWRDVGRELRFFDDSFFPVYYEDVDLCYRAREMGLSVIYQPRAVAYHKESVTMDRQSDLYYSYYHANRLRFVTRHYTPEQIMLEFLPAEAARVGGDMQPEDRRASLNLLDNRPQETASATRDLSAPARMDGLQAHVDDVMRGWRVQEKPFTSALPLIGGMVASLRQRLNNLSTRWYVQPILQQQVDYNASVARALREISKELADLQARIRLDALLTAGMVSSRCPTAGEEIETLRARVEQLEAQLLDGDER